MSKTKDRGFWMVGGGIEEIAGSKLPSNRQTLCRFLQLHSTSKKNLIHDKVRCVSNEIMKFWERARIPTKRVDHVNAKIKKLHSQWLDLKRHSSRSTKQQRTKENKFHDSLDDLFDIAHENALNIITIGEDKEFLLAQREKGRRGTMGSIDTKLTKREMRRQLRTETEEKKITSE